MSSKTWCNKKVSWLKFTVFSWMARRLPTCEEIVPVISQNLDGTLPAGKKIQLVLHNFICEWCKRYEDQLKVMRNAMRSPEAQHAPVDGGLSSEARERMKRSLDQQ